MTSPAGGASAKAPRGGRWERGCRPFLPCAPTLSAPVFSIWGARPARPPPPPTAAAPPGLTTAPPGPPLRPPPLVVARPAVLDPGAAAANYAPVPSLLKDRSGKVAGAHLAIGDGIDVRAGAVVNAAGVWSDHVRVLDEGPSAHGTL